MVKMLLWIQHMSNTCRCLILTRISDKIRGKEATSMADRVNMTPEESFFAVFCIEALADRLGTTGDIVYKKLADDSDILDRYIIPCYGALHTQGKDYILDDLIEMMEKQGVLP